VADPTETPPSPGAVDLGDGRQLYMECRGTGSPTIVLEAGDEDDITSWAESFLDRLGDITTTCAYDRANLGASSEAPGPRRLPELVGDLEKVLVNGRIAAPYVLVAASGGGFISSAFALRNKPKVAGVLFIDVPAAIENPPADLLEMIRWDNPSNVEKRDYVSVEQQAWTTRARIGDIPVTIMSVDYAANPQLGDNAERMSEGDNVGRQKGWLVLSPRARQLVARTSHSIHEDDRDLVVAEIRAVVEAARKR
jgi:pimeloyl-ACP methyl ester carboxylesterase